MIQNKKGTKKFGVFYYTKIFTWGNFLRKVKKINYTQKIALYKAKNIHREKFGFRKLLLLLSLK